MTVSAPHAFDLRGPLPSGVTVLEASAGTGKTYTIAALAARYVAEGVPLDRLLMVTFTRNATSELRERVRERLVFTLRGLERIAAGGAAGDDAVVALLARADPDTARERLARAVAGFDSATITTTHGFCQEVLGGLGVAGDLEPDVAFIEDLSDLASDVVDDLYIRRFSHGGPPSIDRAQAADIATAAIDNPTAAITGGSSEDGEMRVRLARAARAELERRKRAMAVMTYDDLVTRLADTLEGAGGPATAALLRRRFSVVLVDEFQDTDPAQWEIMRLAFAGEGATLVLIADPKQAIYSFRGADVYAYLEAARTAGAQATLSVNWRSDQGLIDAHDALFSGVRLGHAGIEYRHVRAAPEHRRPGLAGAPVAAPLRLRVVLREDPAVSLTRGGFAQKGSASAYVAADLAADVVAMLESGARVAGARSDATGDAAGSAAGTAAPSAAGLEPVTPGHLAVLVRTNRQAAMIREALHGAGVPAAINGAGSVFGTDAARDWLALLEALERPASIGRAHSAALTCFMGWRAGRLAAAAAAAAAAADDDAGGAVDGDGPDALAWEEAHQALHRWARVLRARGVAALLEAISLDQGLPARVLAEIGGERKLTDLRHVGQLLHVAAAAEQLGPTALTGWLRTRIAQADSDTADEERSRRLESDAQAVQVLTVHRSKGLEFPVVYLPFLWEESPAKEGRPVFFHDPAAHDARTIDVSLTGRSYSEHFAQQVAEQRGEDLRLAYVALTRARHQVIAWWAGTWGSRFSPLGRLLFGRDESGDVAPGLTRTPDDAKVLARLARLAEEAGHAEGAGGAGAISVERASGYGSAVWTVPDRGSVALRAADFDRRLDLRWRRTSYTDITAAAHDAWVASEPEQPLLADEPAGPEGLPGGPPGPAGPPSPVSTDTPGAALSALGSMPAGVHVGTFVHRVLEATDFAAPDLEHELALRVAEVQARRAVEIGGVEAVVSGLAAVLRAPLGTALGGLRLCDVGRADRMDELGFELPLAGGDRPSGWLTLSRVAALLRAHLDPADPLFAYAARLDDPGLRSRVRGYLTGSLDLVLRLTGPDGPRFAVIDYKTNWLGAPDRPLRVLDYGSEAIEAEMSRRHYWLQALLYIVALHRYLRWRLAGYEPSRHLAGVGYLFVRGMAGGDDPAGAGLGVHTWRPPAALVTALSDALEGE
jgi:exodeoxyribonuclease V beta subunit